MTDTTDLVLDDEAKNAQDEPTPDTDDTAGDITPSDEPDVAEQTFADFDVAPELVAALEAQGIVHPFPIQALTLPMALDGHDIIGQARTGTGKTLAFGLPLLQRIDPDEKYVQALVITPTRELTIQVATDLGIGDQLGLHVTAIYGGVPIEPQTEALHAGAQVVVGTPGRLLDHVGRGNLDLSRCTQLVLDEADEMLDMGFLPDIERLVDAIGEGDRHTMLFSATMPAAIVSLARRYMDSPTFLRAASDEPETAPTVDQYFLHVHRMDKPRVLARIMQTPERGGAFVFTRTKMMASRLVDDLEGLGIAAVAVHGDLRQAARERNLDKFRRGRADILVATEVAARGLDVDNVTHVVNYDCPDDHKMYLHRIGRTARAGAKGVAVTFCEYNEIDRVNVIRKTIDAHDGEDPVEVFSSSDLLADWFDLPDETPWAALRRKRREGGGSGSRSGDGRKGGGSGRKGGSSRDGGSSRKGGSSRRSDSDGGGERAGGSGRDGGRDARAGGSRRSTRGGDASSSNGTGSARSRSDDDRRGGSSAGGDAVNRSRSESGGRSGTSADPETLETRTRTRTRVREDAARGRDRDTGTGDGSDRPARKRARTSRSGGAGGGRSASSRSDRGDSDRGDSDRGDGDRDRGDRSRGDSGSGRNSGSGGSGSSRSRSGTGSDSRGSSSRGKSRSQSSSSRGSEGGRSTRTTADRPTRRGDDARGDGSPGLARRVLVEHLP